MIHHQQGLNKSSTENLPSWTRFHLEKFDRIEHSANVILGHHLVVLVINHNDIKNENGNEDYTEITAYLLAFNLEDHSVQKIEIDAEIFEWHSNYSFLKYGENQIIKYAWNSYSQQDNDYKMVKCEGIKDENGAWFSEFTAQIYKDCLYVYGKVKDEGKGNELWSFDLENCTWKLCETTGEAPPVFSNHSKDPYSFIYQDNFYIYRVFLQDRSCLPDLFMLDLNSMTWKKIEQQEKYLGGTRYSEGIGGTIYQDHFVTLRQDEDFRRDENALCFLNLHTKNTWSVFDIKDNAWSFHAEALTRCLMTYKNLVLGLATAEEDKSLIVAIISIDNFGISAPKSAEEEHLSSLFLSENESDIAFKIEAQIAHAHKSVLMKKSRYFEGLFKSGMAESIQEIIEIKDCEYEIFKEFLRWIYQGTVNIKDENQAIKLYILADKYVQEDLHQKCFNFLLSTINMKNVYTILDFAHQENITSLKSWCLKAFKDKLNALNVASLIKYLDRQEDSEFQENNKEFRNFAFNFVLDNFFAIYENKKGNVQLYEDFLIENIETDTIPPLATFLGQECQISEEEKDYLRQYKQEENRRRKEILGKCLTQLKEAVFGFVEENSKIIIKSEIAKEFPNDFLRDFILYTTENLSNVKAENQVLKSEKKRMEPSQNDLDGEGESHELKKTKKSDSVHGN